MLSRWPIRNKLLLGIGLLLVLVATLTASACYGLYAYRGLVKSLRDRSTELPLATEMSQLASDLRSTLSELRGLHAFPTTMQSDDTWGGERLLREQFRMHFEGFQKTLVRYRQQLDANAGVADSRIADDRLERETVARIETTVTRIAAADSDRIWLWNDANAEKLARAVDDLHRLAVILPSHLYRRFQAMARDVRLQYRTAIGLTWATSTGAAMVFVLFVQLFYRWVFRPLQLLIEGSRKVAAGNFQHRIHLETQDEMSELADAMNDMTSHFQSTRDDLDRQVQERTKQVVRSEQLASVGFLAAGVAHEINNPLASIALCGESLEGRLAEILPSEDARHAVIYDYVRMIQDEAFRCKGITEKLLDFSRMGDIEKHPADLRELAANVIDMIRHLGRYQGKQIELTAGTPVVACVNAQEMKQVVLNLLTNALDSLDPGGTVWVDIRQRGAGAELIVVDNGSGMTEEVQKHLFEPFYTRRRGGQGTGLGLSITFRIVADHDGRIEATSEGVGKGSKFVVILPLADEAERPASWTAAA